VLLKLKCIYNFNFLKFKLFFTYLAALFKVLISAYKVLIYLTLKRKLKSKYKRIREYY
jgi:hypothetical protein